ncbi:MAG: hypothetical protein ACYC2U_00555 [Candidatus Amoebophilus sp.]
MSHALKIRSLKLIIKLTSLCCLLTIASCQKECKPRALHHKESDFKLKVLTKHLARENRNIRFKVEKNKSSNATSNGRLFLRLTRKEGQSATIMTRTGTELAEISPGLFEYNIKKLDEDIDDLEIKIDAEKEQRAVFELELVYNQEYQGKPKRVTWEYKDIRLAIKGLPRKLYDHKKGFPFKIKSKGKDKPDEDQIVLTFTRKDGHKAYIKGPEGSPNFKSDHQAGIFELSIQPNDFVEANNTLSIEVEPGETKATFDVQLAYKGTKIGKSKTITWMAKKINYSLKNVTQDLRGDNNDIEFSVKLKGHELEDLDDNLILRITKTLDSNARIIGATEKEDGEIDKKTGKLRTFFELPITKENLKEHLETKGKEPIKGLSIEVDKGDTCAQFKLQLVYNNMNVGKHKLVTWRAADIRLELKFTKENKKLVGEGDGQIIKFSIDDKGKDRPEESRTILRIERLVNTNAKIELATAKAASDTTASKSLEVGPGIFEIPLTNYEIESSFIDKLRISTQKGDKEAQFNVQLFYDGMEIGKPKTITWKAKDVRLELAGLPKNKKIVGRENTNIEFKIKSKGKDQPEAEKPLILRFTRLEGYDAKIEGEVQGKKIEPKGHGVFELELDSINIGNTLAGLNMGLRDGEIKAKFELQLVYDGIAIGQSQTLIWEAEHVQLDIQDLTERLRGDTTDIKFKIKNKGKNNPEKNELLLRLTRKKGYNSKIVYINGEVDKFKDKGEGLYELKINIDHLNREIADLRIDPRVGEAKAEFRLQLVYDGIDIGDAKTLIWEEKDIQLQLTNVHNKLGGEDDKIKFTIVNKGKDKPEKGKLYIKFIRNKGHLANIGRVSTGENMDPDMKPESANETGKGFFEFLLNSDDIGNEIADFVILPREGERKAKFTMQLVYDTVEIGKPKTITWVEKVIGLYITELSTLLRGHGEENTTISFKIKRDAKDVQEKNSLEEGKLAVRFTRKEGRSTIKAKPNVNSNPLPSNEKSGIFKFNINTTQQGNLLEYFMIEPADYEKKARFKIELIYDGKKVGNPQEVIWTPKDIKFKLNVAKSQIGGDMKREFKPTDNILEFTVHNKGKDSPKQGELIVRVKRISGMYVDIILKDQPGIIASRFKPNSKEGYFDYELDVKKLGVPINDLMIPSLTGAREASFTLQLIHEGVAIGNTKNVVWKNMTLIRGEEEAKKAKREAERQKREVEKQERKIQKEKEKAEKEREKAKVEEKKGEKKGN